MYEKFNLESLGRRFFIQGAGAEKYRKLYVLLLLFAGVSTAFVIFKFLRKTEQTAYLTEVRSEASSLAMSLDLIMAINTIKMQSFEEHIDFKHVQNKLNQQVIQSAFDYSIFSNFSFLEYQGVSKDGSINILRTHRVSAKNKPPIFVGPDDKIVRSNIAKSTIYKMIERNNKQSQFFAEYNGEAIYVIISQSAEKNNVFYTFSGLAQNLIKENFPAKVNVEAIIHQLSDNTYWHLIKKEGETHFKKIPEDSLNKIKDEKYVFDYKSRFGSDRYFDIKTLATFSAPKKNLFSLIALFSGLVITFLLSSLLYHLITRNIQISKIVADRTADLERESQKSKEAAIAKSRFLANISHEIRTPLNIVLGMSDLLRETSLSSLQKHYIHSINNSGRHLLHLINDILDMTRVDMSDVSFKSEEVKLLQVVEESCLAVDELARNKNLSLYMDYDFRLPATIEVDPSRIRQVLINILSNAVKYTHEGSIYFSTLFVQNYNDQIDNAVVFKVKDTGMGISREDQEEIFKAFYQVNSSIQRCQGGVGLGLSIVSSILKRLGGQISVESNVGVGSTFTIAIPLLNFSSDVWANSLPEIHITQPRNLLLSRNKTLAQLFSKNIKAIGGQPLTAISTEELTNVTEPLNCVFVDIESFSDVNKSMLANLQYKTLVFIGKPQEKLGNSFNKKDDYLHWPNKLLLPSQLQSLVYEEQEQEDVQLQPSSEPSPSEYLRVLIVDDDISNQILFEAYCANEKWDVEFASNGQDALEHHLKHKKFDVLITDLQMPVMDGFTLIQTLNENTQTYHKPKNMIILSADSTLETIHLAKSYNITSFLTKPIRKSEFLAAVYKAGEIRLLSPYSSGIANN